MMNAAVDQGGVRRRLRQRRHRDAETLRRTQTVASPIDEVGSQPGSTGELDDAVQAQLDRERCVHRVDGGDERATQRLVAPPTFGVAYMERLGEARRRGVGFVEGVTALQ